MSTNKRRMVGEICNSEQLEVGGLYEYRSDWAVTQLYKVRPSGNYYRDWLFELEQEIRGGALYISDLFCVVEVYNDGVHLCHKIISAPQSFTGWVHFGSSIPFRVRG